MMPSTKIIKRASLGVKYDFDIWGVSTGNLKSSGLARRLFLKPRFVKDIRKAVTRARGARKLIWRKRTKKYPIATTSVDAKMLCYRVSFGLRVHPIVAQTWKYPMVFKLFRHYSSLDTKEFAIKQLKYIQKRRLDGKFLKKKISKEKFRKKNYLNKLRRINSLTSNKHFSWWKSATKKILRYRDPFPAFDRPKDQSQVYRARSFSNELICKMLRARFYFGYSKEYQFRTFLAKARHRPFPNHPNALAFVLEMRLPYILLRVGFVRNFQFAQYLVKLGCVSVNGSPIFDIHYIMPFRSWCQLKFPPSLEHLRKGQYAKNRLISFQKITLASHFEINWKLWKVRLVKTLSSKTAMLPFFTTSIGAISSFYSQLGYTLRSEQYNYKASIPDLNLAHKGWRKHRPVKFRYPRH